MRFEGRADHNFSNGWPGPEGEEELVEYAKFAGHGLLPITDQQGMGPVHRFKGFTQLRIGRETQPTLGLAHKLSKLLFALLC